MSENENCLEGIRCPECGNTDEFYIYGSATFLVVDDGVEDTVNPEWDNDSPTQCTQCKHTDDLYFFMEENQHG